MSESSADRRALLATCVAAAVKAADVIRVASNRLGDVKIEQKGPSDFVSQVDRDAEAALAAVIKERHPDAQILAEEGSPKLQTSNVKLLFVADPLDGTTNFLHGFPWYAVSIAALVDGKQEAAAILNVPTGDLFTAVLNGGARRGGQAIRVSTITEPSRSLMGTGFPFRNREGIAPYMEVLPRIMQSTAGLRRAGSAALDLCDVACGRFEAFWEFSLSPWDVAAGFLIIREAGGVVTDLDGKPAEVKQGAVVAGNPAMHAWLLEQLHRKA